MYSLVSQVQLSLSGLKIHNHTTRFHPKSNPLAKGGAKPRHLQALRASALTERPNDFGPKIGGLPSSLVPRQHATPSKSLFSEDVEPPIAARRGGGGAATRRARIPLLTRCFALVEHGVAAVAVCATSAAKCGMLHEHLRHDQLVHLRQNYRVSIVNFERQWSCRVAWLGCCSVYHDRCLCDPLASCHWSCAPENHSHNTYRPSGRP